MAIKYEKYNPNWNIQFQEIKNFIFPKVSLFVKEILHVGSTSIKGMSAKPIIDIDMVVDNFNYLSEIVSSLSEIGYNHSGDQGIKDREVFQYIGDQPKVNHHLYLIKEDSTSFRNHIYLKRTS